jgi:hypothetical protein
MLRRLRSRYVYRACDALITARLGSDAVVEGWRVREANYRRVQRLVTLAARVLPGPVDQAVGRLYRPGLLPFDSAAVELLGHGAGSTVFLLTNTAPDRHRPPMVLKVLRRSVVLHLDQMLAHLRDYMRRYEVVRSWYPEDRVLLPSYPILVHGPLLGRSAAAAVQPYVEGEKWDFFDFVRHLDARDFFQANTSLALQFARFAESTLQVADEAGLLVDLVGRNNLLLARRNDGFQLHLIDHGVLRLDLIRTKAPRRYADALDRIAWLRALYAQASDACTTSAVHRHETQESS